MAETHESQVDHIPKSAIQHLIDALRTRGYRVLAALVRDGAVVWDEVVAVADLPIGWCDSQEPGQYRLARTDAPDMFGVVHGPQSIKPLTFASVEPLLQIERTSAGFTATPRLPQQDKIAVLGVRACDLAGLAIQDRIFLNDTFKDPYYETRRKSLFLIAVNCTRSLSTCLCVSTQTGPRAARGFDLALTELEDGFLIEAASEDGRALAAELPLDTVTERELQEGIQRIDACATSQIRRLDQSALPQALYDAHDHPRWDHVAARCLSCTNCTMVCPTCFCHTVEERPDLAHHRTEHSRLWDSCFTQEHGYIHGKNIRPTIKDRYRMWLTHKLAAWVDQFGMSGCVGCGRCITWCPVGIDLTEELPALLTPTSMPGEERPTS
ncbi:cytochrome c [Nitrospira sp.]|nr:cytochrome c [Nitrospira sp.]